MKVLNLQCGQRHAFEGWFGSEDDFQTQLQRGLVECPICADSAVVKLPSAPRLNLGTYSPSGLRAGSGLSDGTEPPIPASPAAQAHPPAGKGTAVVHAAQGSVSHEQQAAFLSAVRHVLANTEDVGDRFADQARAMHYGDAESRNIRGLATPQEAIELIEEGIEIMAMPLPASLKETLQ